MGICSSKETDRTGRKDFSENNNLDYINNDEIEKNLEETIFKFKIEEMNKNEIKKNNEDINKDVKKDMYDAIFSCESIKELFDKGWKYKLSHKFIQRFYRKEKAKFCPLCVIGETNKGKTFIVNLLTGNQLKSGIEYKTEGISCKLTNFKSDEEINTLDDSLNQDKFLVFDTAGRSEPLLIDPKKRATLKDENLKREVELSNRDLKRSEEFMKNVLIKNSRIILVVVNQLSLAEQIFLYELKNDANFLKLFIVHNLFNFQKREDLEDYINNTIFNTIYFNLRKIYFTKVEEDKKDNDKPYYFREDITTNGKERALIAHLILGDLETKDPWINTVNKRTLKFLIDEMQIISNKDFFYVDGIIYQQLRNEEIINEEAKLEQEKSKEKSQDYEEGIIKLKLGNQNINKKNEESDFEENTEFNIFGYTPDYIFYKDEINSKFIIEIECSGLQDESISIKGKTKKGKVTFQIKGKKIYPKELHIKDKSFSISFMVNTTRENIIIETSESINKIKPKYEKGIYRKEFPMKKAEIKNTKNIYPNKKKKEIISCLRPFCHEKKKK